MQKGSRKDLEYPRVSHSILSTCHIRSRMLAEISTLVFPQSTQLMAIEQPHVSSWVKQALRAAGSTSKGGDWESQQLQCEWKGLRKKTDCDKGNLEVTLSSMETFPLPLDRLNWSHGATAQKTHRLSKPPRASGFSALILRPWRTKLWSTSSELWGQADYRLMRTVWELERRGKCLWSKNTSEELCAIGLRVWRILKGLRTEPVWDLGIWMNERHSLDDPTMRRPDAWSQCQPCLTDSRQEWEMARNVEAACCDQFLTSL